MTIYQTFRNALLLAKYRVTQLFRGQNLYEVESAFFLNLKHTPKNKVTLKMHQYPELNQFLTFFLNSAATGGRVIGDNLTFVIGAQRVGKTHFLQQGINNFLRLKSDNKESKWQPDIHRYVPPQAYDYESRCHSFDNQFSIILSFNFKQNKLLNFQGFVDTIQEKMIGELIKMNRRLGGCILDHNVVKEVLLSQNAQQYLFIYIKDIIYSIMNGTEPIYISQQQCLLKLSEINEIIKVMEPHDFFTSTTYDEVIKILSDGLKVCMTETAIRLFVSVGKRIEYQHRNEVYQKSWHITGIESTNILLSLLNFICGFGAYNKTTVQRYYSGQAPEINESNWIKAGNRIDVALVLMNLDALSIWNSQALCDFIDHLVSRTAGANGIRTHFPIIIEVPGGAEVEDMLSMAQFQTGTVPFIQIPGYLNHSLLKSGLAKMFSPKILKRLFLNLGKNPQSWTNALTELGTGASIDDIVKGQAKFIKKQAIIAQAKFNRIFTTQQAQPFLADSVIRLELIQHLRFLLKGNGMIVFDRPGYYLQYMTRPLMQAMQRQGLIYHGLYLGCLDLSHLVTIHKLRQIKNELFNAHWVDYLRWRILKKGRYTMLKYQFVYKEKYDQQSVYYDMFVTYRPQNHLAQTYYGPGFNYTHRYSRLGVFEQIGN